MRKLNVMDRQTDGRTDRRTGGIAISPIPGPTGPAGDKNQILKQTQHDKTNLNIDKIDYLHNSSVVTKAASVTMATST